MQSWQPTGAKKELAKPLSTTHDPHMEPLVPRRATERIATKPDETPCRPMGLASPGQLLPAATRSTPRPSIIH